MGTANQNRRWPAGDDPSGVIVLVERRGKKKRRSTMAGLNLAVIAQIDMRKWLINRGG